MFRLAILLTAACAVYGTTVLKGKHHYQPAKSRVGSCEVDVRLDISGKNPPVILVEDEQGEWKLGEPTTRARYNSYIDLSNKKILLACPGERNTLKIGNRQVTEVQATCSSNGGTNYFIIEGKEYKIDSLKCSQRATPYEYISGERCMGDGNLLQLGYMVNNKMHEVITTCHRLRDGKTYYSRHILNGNGLPQRGNGGRRPDEEGRPKFSFQNKALYKGFPPYKFFYQDVELNALSQAIGSTAARDIFNEKENRYFAKGHLSPNADFPMESTRDVTFLFVNVQPQWQEINGGNWNEVEIANRFNAAATGKKYEVITGASDNLAPKNKDVFLDFNNERLPVPLYYTKLVREVESNKCVAFVSTNFPQDSNPQPKCNDICADYDWPTLKEAKHAGYVYCCSYDEFASAFPKAAPEVDCSGGILPNMNRS